MNLRLIVILVCLTALAASPSFSQDCRCRTCEDLEKHRGPQWQEYWEGLRARIRARRNQVPTGPLNLLGTAQVVFLDFDSGSDGMINYTPAQRDQVQAAMEVVYSEFAVSFTQTLPTGQFSTIVFNEGSPGGLAEDTDFRNLNKSDNAVMNADGLGLMGDQLISFTANIAAHELGHLLGLRHGDSFGPVGSGIIPPFGTFYEPDYLGPQNAFETFDHIMATPGLGAPLSEFFTPNWFSERSSVKLAYAEDGVPALDARNNDSIATAQELAYQTILVPNTIVDGENMGTESFSMSAAVVIGTLDGVADARDIFRIEGSAGDLLNIEVISNATDRLSVDPINPNISVFDSNSQFVDYYGVDAFNESELEPTMDAIIIDLVLSDDGPLFLEVASSVITDSGNYELFVYRFNGVHGDVNCDGAVNLLDVSPFIDALSNGEFLAKADINLDGQLSLLDVSPFVDLLNGQ